MWFSQDEYAERLTRCQAMLAAQGFDHLLVLEPENVTYLTGFYTAGYQTSFQAALIPAEGSPTIIVRYAELYHLEQTAAWPDETVVWLDGESENEVLLRALDEVGVRGPVAVEASSWRAPYSVIHGVIAERADLAFQDIGENLNQMRFVKSPAEIELHRRAGAACAAAHEAAQAMIRPGVSEREIAIAASAAAVRAGSESTFPGPIAAGARALHIHALFSEGVVAEDDLVFLEMDAEVKTYHSRCMRTVKVGPVPNQLASTYQHFVDVQDRALETVRAGVSCRVADDILRKGVLDSKWVDVYPNKTFYGMGSMLWPNTYERLEVTPNADFTFEAGMVFHTYLSARGLNISESIVVTEAGYERLTTLPRGLIRR